MSNFLDDISYTGDIYKLTLFSVNNLPFFYCAGVKKAATLMSEPQLHLFSTSSSVGTSLKAACTY